MLTLQIDELGAEVPRSLDIPGLESQLVGNSVQSNFTMSGGQMQQQTAAIYQYQALASTEGTLKIPEIEIPLAGGKVKTPALELQVVKGSSRPSNVAPPGLPGGQKPWRDREQNNNALDQNSFFVKVLPEKKEIYVGETIEVKIKVFMDSRMQLVNFQRQMGIQGENFVFQQVLGPDVEIKQDGAERYYEFKEEVVDGRSYRVLTFRTSVSSVKPGDFAINPVSYAVAVRAATRRRQSPFQSLFGDDPFMDEFFARPQEIRRSSEAVAMKVLPLPKQDQPDNFSGAVGQFSLNVTADKKEVEIDQPLVLTSKLTGHGNFERISELKVDPGNAWKAYPVKSEFKGADELQLSGVKTFEQTFLASGAGTEAPALGFSFFNPATKKYVTLHAPAIPVVIRGEAKRPAAETASTSEKTEPKATPASGIEIFALNASDLHPFPPDPLRSKPFLIANGLAALAILGLGIRAYVKRGNRLERRQALLARRHKQSELRGALRKPGITERDFAEKAEALLDMHESPKESEALKELMSWTEALRWSGQGQTATPMQAERQKRYLEILENSIQERA